MAESDETLDDAETRRTERWVYEVLGRPLRRAAVRACLAGNDTLCFTERQYQAAYERASLAQWVAEGRPAETYPPTPWSPGLAAMHLRTQGCREVGPGVWTIGEV